MPDFLEKKLKAEYGAKSPIVYATLNKIGAMRGSKITPKGRAMERKHTRDTRAAGVSDDAAHAARARDSRRGFGLPGITKKPSLAQITGIRR